MCVQFLMFVFFFSLHVCMCAFFDRMLTEGTTGNTQCSSLLTGYTHQPVFIVFMAESKTYTLKCTFV